MKIFNFFRNAEFVLCTSMTILLASCSQYDLPVNSPIAIEHIAGRTVNQHDIDAIAQLTSMAIIPSSTANNFDTFTNWINLNGGTVNYNRFFDSSDAMKIMDDAFEDNIAFAKANVDFSMGELAALDTLVSKITKIGNQEILSNAINQYKLDISNLTLPDSKIAYYDDLFTTFDLLNKVDGVSFDANVPIANANRCVVNMIGLALAYGALFTIEVGSFGAGTVLTCVGFVWASATFGGGCR